jgi:hypothetical protein
MTFRAVAKTHGANRRKYDHASHKQQSVYGFAGRLLDDAHHGRSNKPAKDAAGVQQPQTSSQGSPAQA